MCLNQYSVHHQKYMLSWQTCPNHAENTHGAIDEFGQAGLDLPGEYVAEEVRQRINNPADADPNAEHYKQQRNSNANTTRKGKRTP